MNWSRIEEEWSRLWSRARESWAGLAGRLGKLVAGQTESLRGTLSARCGDATDRSRLRHQAAPSIANGLGLIGAGAAAMYFLDPDRGRRRRALVRDQFVHALNALDDAVGAVSRDARNRARGLSARARSLPDWFVSEAIPAEVLAARVRATLGRYASYPRAVTVAARGGLVTLGGPIARDEADGLLAAVAAVPGVVEVVDHLDRREPLGAARGSPDGRHRTGVRPARLQANWSPTARLLVGSAGAALLVAGARRQGVSRFTLGALGAGLLTRAATNTSVRCLFGGEQSCAPEWWEPGRSATGPARTEAASPEGSVIRMD